MANNKKIVLVDGSSYLFRAYHALPPLISPRGHPTGAIYGVVNMLKNLYKAYSPDFFAVVFDAKGKTFRHDLYSDYKANRSKMDDDLAVQIVPLQQIIQALGYPLLIYSGVEADDVLGTLAKLATSQNLDTIISTGDKDLAQLVDSKVSLINTMNNEILDKTGVENKYGVKPEQIIDFLTLTGDTSDNIPGVNKVGPKTAIKWLRQYHNLDNIISNADKFTGKIGEYLREAINGNLSLSKQLVTIDCVVPLEHQLADLQVSAADENLLSQYYQEFGFKQWLAELSTDAVSPIAVSIEPTIATNYQTILTATDLQHWLDKITKAEIVSIDTETTSLNIITAELVGISFCVIEGEAAYLPLQHSDPNDELLDQQLDYKWVLAQLKPILEDKNIAKVGHNLKYDVSIFSRVGIELNGITDDSMLQSYVLNSVASRHSLEAVAKYQLRFDTVSFSDIAGSGKKQLSFDLVHINVATNYAAEDADISLRLFNKLTKQLAQNSKLNDLYNNIEIPLLKVLAKIEQNGVLVATNKLLILSQELGEQIITIENKAYQLAGEQLNLASPKQIQHILYDKLKLPIIKKTPKGQPSTAEAVLSELANDFELPQYILAYRSLSKLKSTYTDALPKQVQARTGRIHTSYQQAVAATGRLSSTNPNLQNIPIRTENGRKIRHAFIAAPNKLLIAADYSQIELRIMADLSNDDSLLATFKNNIDIHSSTAMEVFGIANVDQVGDEQRRHAKAINFGLIYGMSAFGLSQQLKISLIDAQKYIDLYFARYPKVKNYMASTRDFAREHGFVETLFGRRLYLPDINHKNARLRQYAERTAINAPMQGTAADLIKLAMIEVARQLNQFESMIIMQVHDELVLEVPKSELDKVKPLVINAMQNVANLKVPLVVEVGVADNWDDAH